jgi:hypothetical protein
LRRAIPPKSVAFWRKRSKPEASSFSGVFLPENEEAKGFATRLDRTGAGKVHETTKMIPKIVFDEEIRRLKPAPTLSSPVLPRIADVRPTSSRQASLNSIRGKKRPEYPSASQSLLSEKSFAFFGNCPPQGASHNVCLGKGQGVGLPKNSERFKETKYDELKTKVASAFEGVEDAATYIGRIIEKEPRYARRRLLR